MPRRDDSDPGREIGPLFDYEGRPDQAVASDFLWVPRRVELRGDCLWYRRWAEEQSRPSRSLPAATSKRRAPERTLRLEGPLPKMPGTDLLDDFMKLASAPDEQILTFAKRWGVLDLCRHGLPTGHVPHPLLVSMDHGGRRLCSPLAPDDVDPLSVDFARLEGLEPLKYWRMWAKRARALMRIAATLKSLKPGAVADWKDFFDNEWLLPDGRPHKTKILGSLGKSHVMDQDFLCTLLNHWIMTGQVAPMLVRRGNGPVVIRFSCGLTARLFGTIGLQMLVRVSGVGSMAICAACGILFKPDRAPSPARLSFCQKCGRKAAVRLAKQRLNSRKLQALEMHGRGEPVATIARTVHSRPSTVLGWLKEKGA